jgi:hypothetical protein
MSLDALSGRLLRLFEHVQAEVDDCPPGRAERVRLRSRRLEAAGTFAEFAAERSRAARECAPHWPSDDGYNPTLDRAGHLYRTLVNFRPRPEPGPCGAGQVIDPSALRDHYNALTAWDAVEQEYAQVSALLDRLRDHVAGRRPAEANPPPPPPASPAATDPVPTGATPPAPAEPVGAGSRAGAAAPADQTPQSPAGPVDPPAQDSGQPPGWIIRYFRGSQYTLLRTLWGRECVGMDELVGALDLRGSKRPRDAIAKLVTRTNNNLFGRRGQIGDAWTVSGRTRDDLGPIWVLCRAD